MMDKRQARSLRSLEQVRPLYMLPAEPLAEDVLIPAFRAANRVDCMVGFFSSEVLASLAPGLATYITSSENSLRLIISPLLRTEDQDAIERGLRSPEQIARGLLEELLITEELLQRCTLECFSWLIRKSRIEIKIALMKNALFHPKVWLFEGLGEVVAAHGSSNVTYAGIHKNIEQIAISKSWTDRSQRYITDKLRSEFCRLWENKDDSCIIVAMPEAVKQRLLCTYSSATPPTESEMKALYGRAIGISEQPESYSFGLNRNIGFSMPTHLRYEDGPFEHQGKAVAAWRNAENRGVLEMATGSGKTITAMICAYRLYEERKPLLIVIAAPYIPLIGQWCDEISPFGLTPTDLTKVGGVVKRSRELGRLQRRFQTGLSDVEAVVVSHDTLCSVEFLNSIEEFNCARLLIADEAHNLGRVSFISNLPEFFDYRLGLSATPVRQYDQVGTDALFGFFGPVVYKFTLEDAIGRCLVDYDYHVHLVYLTETEMDEWFDLTGKIVQNSWRDKEGRPDDYLAKLLRDRRALIETASNKLAILESLLDKENLRELRHTLIYTTDKAPQQLEIVNELLRRKRIIYHQLTAEETADRDKVRRIIGSFQDGDIQVLTAKRVLDEGVNIPQICKSFMLASTTIERQWVQRRGRLLRTCRSVDKTHSIIHDLLVMPPGLEDGLDPDARTLVRSELRRAQEFARLARNGGRPTGPLATLDQLVDVAYL